MRSDCHVCRSEGFTATSRVLISAGGRSVVATLFQVSDGWLAPDTVGLSVSAWDRLGIQDGTQVCVSHPETVLSLSNVRARIYGHRLSEQQLQAIVQDIVRGQYTDVYLSSFLTACATLPLNDTETENLTKVMVDVGERLTWDSSPILDKHSIGGLPGNRTTPIVVAIVAAHGLTIPKTSSRAITSPAGTADTMETLAPVELNLAQIRQVVEREGGCIAWGGSVNLSPADDILIRIERALDLDSEGQLVASVLSKKIAAGSTHLVLDIPVGPTAKVRTKQAAEALARRLEKTASVFGLSAYIILSDGTQPVGRGIGPALEAEDVLSVLRCETTAPQDLRKRAAILAGALLEMGGAAFPGTGQLAAERCLDDGRARLKFQRICEAQGGMRVPPRADIRADVRSVDAGVISEIDNRKIAKAAKLAGAPESKSAGVLIHANVGDAVERRQPVFSLHAQSRGELEYALEYVGANPDIVKVTRS
jgi:thymidine phosphorylase